jgi:ATP synthase protein I
MPSHDARIIRGAAIPTACAGIAAMAISTAVVGVKGLYGALFAVLLVIAFFSVGQVAVDRLSRGNPQLLLPVAMSVYMGQILLVGIVLAVFKGTTAFNTQVFGLTVLGCTLAWTVAVVRVGMKAKIFYVETGSSGQGDRPERQP